MRNRLIVFLFALLFIACGTSKNATTSSDSAAELPSALLWKIEGNGLEQPSYLFGTIHIITSDDFFWPRGTLGAFESASSVVFEIDMDDMFDLSKQMALMTKAFMNDGMTLKDLYSEEDYEVVRSHFDGMGLPMFFLERLKPMFLTVFASGDVELGAGLGGGGNMKSYEMELFELSQQSEKEVEGLESIEFQMSVFDSIPYQVQADMLLETIKMADSEGDTFKQMIDMYKQQNINRMVSAMSEDEGIEGYDDLLLNNRNANWIPVMAEKMKKGPVFFAVGAGHLGGEEGVVRLLQKEGYSLEALSTAKDGTHN